MAERALYAHSMEIEIPGWIDGKPAALLRFGRLRSCANCSDDHFWDRERRPVCRYVCVCMRNVGDLLRSLCSPPRLFKSSSWNQYCQQLVDLWPYAHIRGQFVPSASRQKWQVSRSLRTKGKGTMETATGDEIKPDDFLPCAPSGRFERHLLANRRALNRASCLAGNWRQSIGSGRAPSSI